MKDLLVIPEESGTVELEVRGRREDSKLMLLQRLYVLLFTGPSEPFRKSGGGLSGFLAGANMPDIDAFNALLAICASSAVGSLDTEDREQVSAFSVIYDGETINCSLKFKDGTIINGNMGNG